MKKLQHKISFLFFLCLTIQLFAQPAGKSILLNGINNYFTVPDNAAFTLTSAMSFEAWINGPVKTGQATLISQGRCPGDSGYYIIIEDGKLKMGWVSSGSCNFGTNIYITNNVVIKPFECTHIAVVFKSTEVKMYVNGNLVPASIIEGTNSSIYNSSQPVYIGAYQLANSGVTSIYQGEIDDLRLWNYALTQSEIQNRMGSSLNGNETGLVAYYDMEDQGSGTGFTVLNKCLATGSDLNGTSVGTNNTPSHVIRCSTVSTNQVGSEQIPIIYPNPSNGNFTIEFGSSASGSLHQIVVRNILSQVIYSTATYDPVTTISASEKMIPGMYFVEFSGVDHQKYIVPIVVE